MTASLLGACAPARPRSLVLVSVDTLRADHVGAYGGKLGSTPSMDSLAKDGVLFEDCSSAAPITGPAHATLLSGLYPPDHGVRSNGFHLAASVTTLAEMLSGRGFRTGAVIGGFPLDRRFGFDQGFGSFDDALGPPAGGNGEPERPARAVADAALAWLDAVPVDQPFFLFVHFYDPHADYRPPMDLARLPPYDGEIASVDRELGRILTRLRERGLDRSTAVILGRRPRRVSRRARRGHARHLSSIRRRCASPS
ncbi:MAG: sulfatase [Acidobacteriota bacterium]